MRAIADTGIDDYRRFGVMAALHAISQDRTGARKVDALGYCLGGTLLSIAAAAMARDGDERLKTLTLLAAQTDFSEPGELELFVNESQLAFLEDEMQEAGVLHAEQMTASFQLLRSNDLIWSRMLKNYLLGEREPLNDLMAWNADATRMPARMHFGISARHFLREPARRGRYLWTATPSLCAISRPRSSPWEPNGIISRPGVRFIKSMCSQMPM